MKFCVLCEREREMARARKRGCENSAGLMLIFKCFVLVDG